MINDTPTMAETVDQEDTGVEVNAAKQQRSSGPSNNVHARVGDAVLRAAREGIRGGRRPDDIIREIVSEHQIRLNLSDFRLLLASRPLPERGKRGTLTLLNREAQ